MKREQLEAALQKPIYGLDEPTGTDDFDPWEDVVQGIHGSYASESDALMVEALKAVRDKATFEFIDRRGFLGEFALYVLSGHGLLEYGTSPRGGWPAPEIADLWQPLIDKWEAYELAAWGDHGN
jgi:hypothetical protein